MRSQGGDALHALTTPPSGPCLSVYLPTAAWDGDGRQARIQWKNLLRKAALELVKGGHPAPTTEEILRAAKSLDVVSLAHSGAGGLAVFAAPGFLHAVPLSTEPTEEVVVADRFHLKPLLEEMAEPPRFAVLAFSQNGVRLLEATPTHATEVPLPGAPRTLEIALRYDEHEKSVRSHGGPSVGGMPSALYFGEGGADAPHKDEIVRFARQVAPHVRRALDGAKDPLVLACVDAMAPVLREVLDLPNIAKEFVRGSPDRVRSEELAARAWEIVRDEFRRSTTRDVERFRELAGTGRTAGSLEEVLPAALQGRVETLFLATDRTAWGAFDPATRRVTLHEAPVPADHDLLDDVALAALDRGAVLHVMERKDMPAPTMAAAILRY